MGAIGIIGAGIGGLAAGIALRQRGFDVTIIERAQELGEVGAGIVMGPNAMKTLRALGMEEKVLQVAFEPRNHLLRDWSTGRVLHQNRVRGVFEERFGAGYMQMHRADLLKALQSAFPSDHLCLGHAVVGVEQDGKSVSVSLEGGERRTFDVLVGADGINSFVRGALFGAEAPRFTGNICWRGTVPVDRISPDLFGEDIHVWLGPHGHVVNYLIRRGEVMNFVAIAKADDWRSESWSVEADVAEVIERYKDWSPALLDLFSKASRCYKWAMFDRDPLKKWSSGRITLLGDAAHPMLPYLAQGAAMGIEDAYVLARLIEQSDGDYTSALETYEQVRLPRTSRVQLGARARSKENHAAPLWERLSRNLGYAWQRLMRPTETMYKVEWIYGYDPKAEFG